jgi:hypothetical protein
MEYSTSPDKGIENETFPAVKAPMLGLLAGSISVYCAQLVLAGALTGQPVAEATEILEFEIPSAGMVTEKDPPPLSGTAWMAETSVSIVAGVAGADPAVAVTKPWNVVGPGVVPVSAIRGRMPTFVPPGTAVSTVAL